jgi:hypothetical protein
MVKWSSLRLPLRRLGREIESRQGGSSFERVNHVGAYRRRHPSAATFPKDQIPTFRKICKKSSFVFCGANRPNAIHATPPGQIQMSSKTTFLFSAAIKPKKIRESLETTYPQKLFDPDGNESALQDCPPAWQCVSVGSASSDD